MHCRGAPLRLLVQQLPPEQPVDVLQRSVCLPRGVRGRAGLVALPPARAACLLLPPPPSSALAAGPGDALAWPGLPPTAEAATPCRSIPAPLPLLPRHRPACGCWWRPTRRWSHSLGRLLRRELRHKPWAQAASTKLASKPRQCGRSSGLPPLQGCRGAAGRTTVCARSQGASIGAAAAACRPLCGRAWAMRLRLRRAVLPHLAPPVAEPCTGRPLVPG